MTVVFSASFMEEVLVVRSMLESAGIGSSLLSEHVLDVFPFFENMGRGIRVAVADEDAADALAVVADHAARRAEGQG